LNILGGQRYGQFETLITILINAKKASESHNMRILVTGAAGFIGFHLSRRLLEEGHIITGLDDLNSYYDARLKESRLNQLMPFSEFEFVHMDLANRKGIERLFSNNRFNVVFNFAAQEGIRYSIENPYAYLDTNLIGFENILEGCKHGQVAGLIFASSSSVYGVNTKMPFLPIDNVDYPISLYAVTKRTHEAMAKAYSHLYQFVSRGLRLFTIYGPWDRPDTMLSIFTKRILDSKAIEVFDHSKVKRHFVYIDDAIEGITAVLNEVSEIGTNWIDEKLDLNNGPFLYRIYNLGKGNWFSLMEVVKGLEAALSIMAEKISLPFKSEDVPNKYCEDDEDVPEVMFENNTPITKGIREFIEWYLDYYEI